MVSEPQQISHAIQSGRPTDHLPKLSPDDVVYTAGAPAMTDAVARIAKAAAQCATPTRSCRSRGLPNNRG
jgi:3-phenylpropionate/trans-cinnamate dioxygenase ferredoxin reductase subunit